MSFLRTLMHYILFSFGVNILKFNLFIFKLLVHLEMIFVYGVKEEFHFQLLTEEE